MGQRVISEPPTERDPGYPTPKQILITAAGLCDRYGLCKGERYPGARLDQPYIHGLPCCVGAYLELAARGDLNTLPPTSVLFVEAERVAWNALRRVLREQKSEAIVSLWNDLPETTATDVSAMLRAAAETLTVEFYLPRGEGW